MSFRLRILITTAVLLGTAAVTRAQQCCMPDVGDSPRAECLIEAIHSATLVLGATPLLLVSGIAIWIRRCWRTDQPE